MESYVKLQIVKLKLHIFLERKTTLVSLDILTIVNSADKLYLTKN